MEPEPPVRDDVTLASVRSRGLEFLNYLFWIFAIAALLVAANLLTSLMQRWIGFLDWIRNVFAIPRAAGGPDWWMVAGFTLAAGAAVLLFLVAYAAYRRAWTARLVRVWHHGYRRIDTRVLRLPAVASERDTAIRSAYLDHLSRSPEWRLEAAGDYRQRAEAMLAVIETDIARRAVTAGLVVGLNRNPVVDSISIVAAALELQLHVLTRLGKRPSFGAWTEMLKRTGGSLFLNWYVSREDALYLKLAIKKTAWGMGAASDLAQQAADALDDMDWHEVLGGAGGVPGLHLLSTVTATGLGVGAFGLRHLGNFIESTADDLLQGVLAAGVLYYHGMALAADCLALDQEHRRSPQMNRTISQAMGIALAPAANLLRDQVRALRQFLRERRKLAIRTVGDRLKQGAGTRFDSAREAVENWLSALRRNPSREER